MYIVSKQGGGNLVLVCKRVNIQHNLILSQADISAILKQNGRDL